MQEKSTPNTPKINKESSKINKESSKKVKNILLRSVVDMVKANSTRYQHFTLVVIVLVLLVLVAQQISFRFDLSSNKMYSISPVSKKLVKNLVLPLRIKIFFSKNLPAPYNNLEQDIKDILREYYFAANKNFSYRFYDCTLDKEESSEKIKANIKEAGDYNIFPVQRQFVEKDEVKFTRVYMGMVIQHGDIIERIEDLGQTQALEYKLTRIIQKMSSKISALSALEKPIEVKLFLSSSIKEVAPFINVQGMDNLADEIKKVVEASNKKNYGKLKFTLFDSTVDATVTEQAKVYNLPPLEWQDAPGKLKAGSGYLSLVIDNNGQHEVLPLLRTISMPFVGVRYALEPLEEMEDKINSLVDSTLNLNESIAYLNDKNAPSAEVVIKNPYMPQANNQQSGELANFNLLLSKTYDFESITLDELDPAKYKTLIIVAPKDTFTPWDLFKIDQFLMAGRSIAIFYEKYKISDTDRRAMVYGQAPFIAITTGLESLIFGYGVDIRHNILLDKSSYKQMLPPNQGGGLQQIYFIPKLVGKQINQKFKPIKNISELYLNRLSTLQGISDEEFARKNIKHTVLLRSSQESWLLEGNVINFTPANMQPPPAENATNFKSFPLAYLLEGEFESYYTSVPAIETNTNNQAKTSAIQQKQIANEIFLKKGKKGKLFVMAGVENLKNTMLDTAGESSPSPIFRQNAIFLHNVIDYLNDRADWAEMRSKSSTFSPLAPYNAKANFVMRFATNRQLIKTFNMAILPLIILFSGLVVYYQRKKDKKAIYNRFNAAKHNDAK